MKKLLKITLALMMALGLQLTSLKAVNALNSDLSKVGTYQIPIKSLTSSAPIPCVDFSTFVERVVPLAIVKTFA